MYTVFRPYMYMYMSVFRSISKKVGEYKKLTSELPGIWRTAEENQVWAHIKSETFHFR